MQSIVIIERPVEDVFGFVVDLTNVPSTDLCVESVEKTSEGPIAPTASLTFEQANGATRVTFRGEPNPVGPLKVISPLISRQGQHMWDKRLTRLKRTLEAPQKGH